MLDKEEYIRICKKKMKIALLRVANKKIWIYGAGSGGTILLNILKENNRNVEGFVDRNADNILTKDDLQVKKMSDVNISDSFFMVGLMYFDDDVINEFNKYGINNSNSYYFATGEGVNKNDIVYRGCKIGKYTYGYENFLQYAPIANIGRFCSIAATARAFNNHPLEFVTTHPLIDHMWFHNWEDYGMLTKMMDKYGFNNNNASYENSTIRNTEWITIGNDVWIGANVVVLPGVKIGDGVIIAANSLVCRDIDDYCIVGGNPASIIGRRFPDETISKLKSIAWWEWNEKELKTRFELLYDIDKLLNAKFDS